MASLTVCNNTQRSSKHTIHTAAPWRHPRSIFGQDYKSLSNEEELQESDSAVDPVNNSRVGELYLQIYVRWTFQLEHPPSGTDERSCDPGCSGACRWPLTVVCFCEEETLKALDERRSADGLVWVMFLVDVSKRVSAGGPWPRKPVNKVQLVSLRLSSHF